MTALPGAVIRYARKAADGHRLESLTSSPRSKQRIEAADGRPLSLG